MISEKDRAALQRGGVLVGGILLFVVVGFPLMDAWDSLNKKIDDGEKKIQAVQNDVQDALDANQAMLDLKRRATLHQTAATLNQQSAQLLTQVGRLPSYRSLAVGRLEPLPLRDEEKFHRSAVSIQFTGTMGDLHRFLTDAERATPALKVERLTVQTDPKNPGQVAGQIIVSGYAVVLKKSASS